MLIRDAFKTAIKSLSHRKMRTALTMLGIIIGIASVIILMSIGKSTQDLILNRVQGIGSNLIIIIPGARVGGGFSSPASAQGIVITSLQQRDLDALLREPSILGASAEVRGQGEVIAGENNKTISYEGVTDEFFSVRNMAVKTGRALSKEDIDSVSHVVVIGPSIATTLFGQYVNPLNKTVRIQNVTFRVVGILDNGGTGAFGIDQGNLVIMPITIAQKQLLGINYFNAVIAQARPEYDINFVKDRVSSVLRQNHGITKVGKEDFTIQSQEDLLSILGTITSVLTFFLAAIAAISLIVGGIGIMNIMLVAVTERTREIGLRKSVGATDRDILEQFLIESVLITAIGGVLGILIGAIVVGAIYVALTTFASIGWVFAFPLSAVALGLGVSSFAGLVFGIYPARQAGRKNPIEALRYE